MVESGLLKALFLNIIFGGAAGVVVWWFIESQVGKGAVDILAEWFGYFGLEPPEITRYLTMALSTQVPLAFYSVASLFVFVPNPDNAIGWLDLTLRLFAIAYAASQILHARRKTRISLHQKSHPVDPVTTTLD